MGTEAGEGRKTCIEGRTIRAAGAAGGFRVDNIAPAAVQDGSSAAWAKRGRARSGARIPDAVFGCTPQVVVNGAALQAHHKHTTSTPHKHAHHKPTHHKHTTSMHTTSLLSMVRLQRGSGAVSLCISCIERTRSQPKAHHKLLSTVRLWRCASLTTKRQDHNQKHTLHQTCEGFRVRAH